MELYDQPTKLNLKRVLVSSQRDHTKQRNEYSEAVTEGRSEEAERQN